MANKPIDYQTPGATPKQEVGDIGGTPQKVFDTVAGPNLRLRDNMIQLAACIAGVIIGAGVGLLVMKDSEPMAGLLVGTLIGLVAGVFLSGVALGIYRFVKSLKK
jgi:hypothetical protein